MFPVTKSQQCVSAALTSNVNESQDSVATMKMTKSEIESKAQNQLESTLRFKDHQDDNKSNDNLYIDTCKAELGEFHDIETSNEVIITTTEFNVINDEHQTKQELDESEEENVSDEDYGAANNVCEDVKQSQKNIQRRVTPLRNWSEELPNCKELKMNLADGMLILDNHGTQFTAHSSKDSDAHHPQIIQQILESSSTDAVDCNISSLQDDTESSQNVFICDICDEQFNNKNAFIGHTKDHPKMLSCTFCSYKSYKKNDVKGHIYNTHPKQKSFDCNFCSYKAQNKGTLNRHVNVIHNKTSVYKCCFCSYTANDKSNLNMHINSQHTKNTSYKCTYCDYQTYSRSYLSKHINAKHDKKVSYDCSFCSYKTFHCSALPKHINALHTKNVSYNCSLCSYKTYYRNYLSSHINAEHTKNISYNCSLCSYKAYHKRYITKHLKNVHKRTTKK